MPNKNQPILLTCTVNERSELFDCLGSIARHRSRTDRPAPSNLDGLADLLREERITKIIASDWRMADTETTAVVGVLDDLGITLVR